MGEGLGASDADEGGLDYAPHAELGVYEAEFSIHLESDGTYIQDPYRDLAFSMVVTAARELQIAYKKGKFTENRARIIYWFSCYPAPLPFALCCELIWGDRVSPRQAGKRLIESPELAAKLELPSPPPSYRECLKNMGLIERGGDISAH